MRGNKVRKQILVLSGIALAIAVGALAWYLTTQRNIDTVFSTTGRAEVLLVLEGPAQTVDGFCLLSFSEADTVFFSFPSNLRVRSEGSDFAALEAVYTQQGAVAAMQAVGEVIGLEIPFYLAVDRSAFTGWLEAIGSLEVVVPTDVEYVDTLGESPIVVEVRAGIQQFSPASALAFTVSPDAGDIEVLYQRQQAVLSALLRQGIRSQSARALRAGARQAFGAVTTNLSLADLTQAAQVLHAMAEGSTQGDGLYGNLVEIDGAVATQPSIVQTERRVASLLHGLALLTPGDVRVTVLNGNGVRMMASKTADYLRDRGFQIGIVGNADSFQYETSYVVVLTDEAKAWILRDALPSVPQIVFPETFESHMAALQDYVSTGTDLLLIAGAGLEIE